jgi:low affinity Fe/Cu permease
MIASALALLLLLWYLLFVNLSFRANGSLSAYYGSAGVMAMLLSVVVLVIAAGSLKEEDSFQLFPRLGTFLSLLTMVCWIGTYAWGFLLG